MGRGTILYVGNFELPDKGASANRVMTNRLLFREIGYRTAFLGVTREAQFDGIRPLGFDEDIYERAYPSSTRMWLERSYSLRDILAVAAKYDDLKMIIFYNSPYSLVKRAHRCFSKKGIKVLYDCTEWNAYTKGNKLKRLYKQYDARQIQHHLDRCVDGLIVISSLMDRQYQTKPKVLIPPLVDMDAPMWQQKRTRDDGIFEFCYAGDPEGKDDLRLLIEAYAEVRKPATRLVIIGVQREDFLRAYPESSSLITGLADRLHFKGRVSHEEVITQLINTDCFVFIRQPNLRNHAGFPTKFAEAYTSGTQIIATDISDIRNYADETIQILKEISVESITQTMQHALGRKSKAQLRNSFDYRCYIDPVEHFFC